MHVPSVQAFLGNKVSTALASKLGTKVAVGKINLGFLNRIIIDDVMIYDQEGDSMLCASRLSAKINIIPLSEGKISVSSAQLFGLKANLYKQTADSKPNFQFVLDSLASKDTTKHTPLDLHIGSLIIRRGAIAYNQRDDYAPQNKFSVKHIQVSELSSHIIINHITDNSINLLLKKLSFKDKSGLQVKSLHFKLIANKQEALLKDFSLLLPHSDISLSDFHAKYTFNKGKLDPQKLVIEGGINQSKITLSDIACFVPSLSKFDDAIYTNGQFSYHNGMAACQAINIKTGSGSITLQAKGNYSTIHNKNWMADIDNLNITQDGILFVATNFGKNIQLPKEVTRLGTIHLKGKAHGGRNMLHATGTITTEVGDVAFKLGKKGKLLSADIDTKGISLGHILDNKQLGIIAAHLSAQGSKEHFLAKGTINRLDYNHYSFKNINLDGNYYQKTINGKASISDPNIQLSVAGEYCLPTSKYNIKASINHILPAILGMKVADKNYSLNNISILANNKSQDAYIDLEAPFMSLYTRGKYDFSTLYGSLVNLLADKLPTLPGIKKHDIGKGANDFTLQANITSTEALQHIFNIPLSIESPVHINGNISDAAKEFNLYVNAPLFSYKGKHFNNTKLEISTIGEALALESYIQQGMPYEQAPSFHIKATAANNRVNTLLDYNNHSSKLPITGKLDATTHFFNSTQGHTVTHVVVHPSEVHLGDTKWEVQPADILYRKDELTIDQLSLSHQDQHIIINGKATPSREDSIMVDLKDVDVSYILNLVNFHSVEFAGKASGKAVVKSIFNTPDAYALLDVKDFTFENGPLGILHAKVGYDNKEGQINIDAIADDGPEHQTFINGYVSPKHNFIDLGINAHNTSLKFMENFCGSFMDQVEAWCKGKLNVVGDLSNINLVGDIVAHGSMHMKQLGTTYTFSHLRAHAIPDDIQLLGDSIFDSEHSNQHHTLGHYAIVNGGIHHKHLTRLSYDLDLEAHNFLGFDTHTFGDNTFYGSIYATGKVGIHGKSGETIIDIDATPEPNSVLVYNVASPDAISDKSFIHWHDATPYYIYNASTIQGDKESKSEDKREIASDMRINFLINTNPNLTLKLIMDEQTGDYISLNGSGVIRANYFNKGSFDMFGNYLIDHGVYKLTIQNIIKKDFQFMEGGSITFSGNPYKSPLNLQAKYTVSGVPLSDLNIGRSFSNNIRVDCLMNITGIPETPKVDFSMDLPTVNSDAKQMIYSVINSQEEMNQQVLYLLGVGRFYAQAKNNQASEDATQQSQTSLAMQSILSGTLSQQINNVLSGLVKSNNWNFGANISTGDEGFNNAEYEGTLSGRLLNNRLLFNGQFGYRDNANATQSFIGDFDLRYLIFPNGNLSIHVYNQANDRYFTRNSLNTQGIGLIMKKDFSNFWDLLGIKKKKNTKNDKKKQP